MSDLSSRCGCDCGCENSSIFPSNNSSCACNLIWIILLLSCACGGSDSGQTGLGGIFGGNGCSNGSCNLLIWILLLSCACGGNGSCGC